MKALLKEFKEFINRGNVMDLAVGVIIGGAFTSIVTSLTDNIINPLISVAFVVFMLVKALNNAQQMGEAIAGVKPEEEAAPAPVCPYCLEEVHPGATKCCHCGSDLPQE